MDYIVYQKKNVVYIVFTTFNTLKKMAPSAKHYLLFFTIFISSFVTSHTLGSLGFTVYLIHRDSIKSQFFNNITDPIRYEIKDDPHAVLHPKKGEYLMSYSIGFPPFRTYGSIDTGSGNSITVFSKISLFLMFFKHL